MKIKLVICNSAALLRSVVLKKRWNEDVFLQRKIIQHVNKTIQQFQFIHHALQYYKPFFLYKHLIYNIFEQFAL